jgi:hypothetical protein
LLPQELGCGSGTTCWRRLRDWQDAGVWQRLHETILNWLGDEAAIDWTRASVDSLSVRAKRGASKRDRTPLTEGSRAPGATWWWIATAFPWRSASPQRMPTTPRTSSRLSMPSRRSSARVADRGDRASVRPNSTPTRPTTLRTCGVHSALAASHLGLHGGGSKHLNDWAVIAG